MHDIDCWRAPRSELADLLAHMRGHDVAFTVNHDDAAFHEYRVAGCCSQLQLPTFSLPFQSNAVLSHAAANRQWHVAAACVHMSSQRPRCFADTVYYMCMCCPANGKPRRACRLAASALLQYARVSTNRRSWCLAVLVCLAMLLLVQGRSPGEPA